MQFPLYIMLYATYFEDHFSYNTISRFYLGFLSFCLLKCFFSMLLFVVYYQLAQKLTAWETHRTETEHGRSLTFKLFLFQCVNYYSAIVYIALFKGS